MHLPEIDRYADLDSPLHCWDPRVKLVGLLPLVAAVVLAPDWTTCLLGLALAAGLVGLSEIPLRFVLVHLRWVLLFCAFLLVIVPLTAGGRLMWRLGPVGFSLDGLLQAGLITVRATAAVLVIFTAVSTARFHVTLKALQNLRVPQTAVQILAFSYRYVFVLLDELRRMRAAARARAAGSASWSRNLHNTGSMIGMLLVRSFDRTDRVYRAMLARGYTGSVRTLSDFRLRSIDLVKGTLALCAAAALLSARWVT